MRNPCRKQNASLKSNDIYERNRFQLHGGGISVKEKCVKLQFHTSIDYLSNDDRFLESVFFFVDILEQEDKLIF